MGIDRWQLAVNRSRLAIVGQPMTFGDNKCWHQWLAMAVTRNLWSPPQPMWSDVIFEVNTQAAQNWFIRRDIEEIHPAYRTRYHGQAGLQVHAYMWEYKIHETWNHMIFLCCRTRLCRNISGIWLSACLLCLCLKVHLTTWTRCSKKAPSVFNGGCSQAIA